MTSSYLGKGTRRVTGFSPPFYLMPGLPSMPDLLQIPGSQRNPRMAQSREGRDTGEMSGGSLSLRGLGAAAQRSVGAPFLKVSKAPGQTGPVPRLVIGHPAHISGVGIG